MVAARQALRSLVLFVGLIALVLVGLNLTDEDLKPEVGDLLREHPAVSSQQSEAFQYLLGLRVPADEDPWAKGAEFYERRKFLQNQSTRPESENFEGEKSLRFEGNSRPCGGLVLCREDQWKEKQNQIQQGLKLNQMMEDRFEKLVAKGPYARDIQPSLGDTGFIILFMDGVHWYHLKTTAFLYQGQASTAWSRVKSLQSFLAGSLDGTQTMLESLILTSLLGFNRDYARVAAATNPAFKKLLMPNLDVFKISQTYDQVSKEVFRGEMQLAHQLLLRPRHLDDFNLADGNPSARATTRLFDFLIPLLYKENKTLNLYFISLQDQRDQPCIQQRDDCPRSGLALPWYSYFSNPMGKLVVRISNFQDARFQKLRQTMRKLHEPLSVETP